MSWQRLTFEREKALAEAEQKWERRERCAGTGPGGAEFGSWGVCTGSRERPRRWH